MAFGGGAIQGPNPLTQATERQNQFTAQQTAMTRQATGEMVQQIQEYATAVRRAAMHKAEMAFKMQELQQRQDLTDRELDIRMKAVAVQEAEAQRARRRDEHERSMARLNIQRNLLQMEPQYIGGKWVRYAIDKGGTGLTTQELGPLEEAKIEAEWEQKYRFKEAQIGELQERHTPGTAKAAKDAAELQGAQARNLAIYAANKKFEGVSRKDYDALAEKLADPMLLHPDNAGVKTRLETELEEVRKQLAHNVKVDRMRERSSDPNDYDAHEWWDKEFRESVTEPVTKELLFNALHADPTIDEATKQKAKKWLSEGMPGRGEAVEAMKVALKLLKALGVE